MCERMARRGSGGSAGGDRLCRRRREGFKTRGPNLRFCLHDWIMSICQGPSAPFSLSLQAPSISRYVAFHKVGSTFTLVRSPWQLITYRRLFSDQKGSLIEPFALAALSDAKKL